jgi:hypothetical protein
MTVWIIEYKHNGLSGKWAPSLDHYPFWNSDKKDVEEIAAIAQDEHPQWKFRVMQYVRVG